MILLLLFMFHIQAEELQCPPSGKFQFGNVELKLNLDGNAKPDAIVRCVATQDERQFYRRALVFDAPKKIATVSEEQWLEPCQEGGEEPSITTITYEKVKAGNRDL